MKKLSLCAALITVFISCSEVDSAKKELVLPQPPSSVDAVKAELNHKSYLVADAGTMNLFNEYDWSSASSDTTKFFKEYMAERQAFSLDFVNDSTVKVNDEKKLFEAKYSFEKDTSKAVLLNIHYVDSSFSFNPGEPMMMTSTYKIRGINGSNLLLETPREMNRRKVILLMKKK